MRLRKDVRVEVFFADENKKSEFFSVKKNTAIKEGKEIIAKIDDAYAFKVIEHDAVIKNGKTYRNPNTRTESKLFVKGKPISFLETANILGGANEFIKEMQETNVRQAIKTINGWMMFDQKAMTAF